MIEFRNVSKYRSEHGRRRFLLKEASFVIPDRTSVALLGGAKGDNFQMLRMISGTLPVDSGKILTDSKISWPVGESIGMSNLLTARQNIGIVCGIHGLTGHKSNHIAEMVAGFCGLGKHIDDPMSTYRAEMKERISFILPLAMRFDYFLVGRRIAVGSGEFRAKSREAFLKTVKETAVILATGNLKLAKMLCTHAVVLQDGAAVYYDDIGDAIASLKEQAEKKAVVGGGTALKKKSARKVAKKKGKTTKKSALPES